MKYVQYINSLIKSQVHNKPNLVIFGQNVNAGSCLGGLTSGLSVQDGLIINAQNSENTLVGIGFGLMLNSVSSIFFMKQMDFLLLGIDHLVNTYNIVRQANPSASFTIFPIIVDSGYEGPQSSLNNFDDFCSIADIEGYTFTNKEDTRCIISNHLVKPGFRVMSTGQRLLQEEVLDIEILYREKDCKYFQYSKGENVSIICFNQALPYGIELRNVMFNCGISASLFSINSHLFSDYSLVINDIENTKKMIVIDDTKSKNSIRDHFISDILDRCILERKKVILRSSQESNYYPCKDTLEIDYQYIANYFLKK